MSTRVRPHRRGAGRQGPVGLPACRPDTPGLEIVERIEDRAASAGAPAVQWHRAAGNGADRQTGRGLQDRHVGARRLPRERRRSRSGLCPPRAGRGAVPRDDRASFSARRCATCRWCRVTSPTWRSISMPRRCWSTAPPGPRTGRAARQPRGRDGEAACHRGRAAVIDQAVQLHGGDGVRHGMAVESLYREIRALRIYEGASDVQKIVIARAALAEAAGAVRKGKD
jgi:hypothetical protein